VVMEGRASAHEGRGQPFRHVPGKAKNGTQHGQEKSGVLTPCCKYIDLIENSLKATSNLTQHQMKIKIDLMLVMEKFESLSKVRTSVIQ
jgi:hypothetical protein